MEKLLQRLKAMRKAKRLTQEAVSKELGFESKNGYWSIENGKTRLTVEHVRSLANIYGISAECILGSAAHETFL
jgi:transcriptional regulator with XRE-family HTH domain